MSPTTIGLQYLHNADPNDLPANGDVPVYSSAGNGYVPTAGVNGNVTAAGTLTSNQVVIGQGTKAVAALGSLGTTTTVLHGNAGGAPSFASVIEADITLADNSTNNSSTGAHGFLKKLDNNSAHFMDGQGNWSTPVGSGGNVTAAGTLTSNALVIGQGAQDVAVLGSLGTTTTLLHGNAAGAPTFATVVEADITLADNTTNNASTSAHGFLKKLDNSSIHFMNGQGNWAEAPGGCVVHFSFGDTGGFNPADATTYYFGNNISFDPSTTPSFFVVIMGHAGTVKNAYGNFPIAGVLASAGSSTLTVRNITATTSEVISSAVSLTATPARFNNTSMTLAFSAGDELDISWLTPTWGTNPTIVYGQLDLYVQFT